MSIDLPGFADPVLESQACFRAVLDALARPGTLHEAGVGLVPPAPLVPAAAAVLLTLVDGETQLWMAPEFVPARDWVNFHCGTVPVAAADTAAFVLAAGLPDLAALEAGSDEQPDASATVILQVAAFGRGRRLCLTGPGLWCRQCWKWTGWRRISLRSGPPTTPCSRAASISCCVAATGWRRCRAAFAWKAEPCPMLR